ncbi:FAD binding domain-containing protein [Aspergillus pseudoustus]|uniref:FAD binding domain-containing protein n=1 Tax=Aspergillus pseudoustus TaxID=1810923 RepID=A0ABR4J3T2_9EURO
MAESQTKDTQFNHLRSLLDTSEIITADSPEYKPQSQTWAYQKQRAPRLVVRPRSVESLAKVIAYLYSTQLDFAIYGHGYLSTSAEDVLVNMSAFDEFHVDPHSELVTVGAGHAWSEVYRKLESEAPGYGIVGARTPCVGVAGTIVTGGFSWLSGERGCISDPINMLDAKVVKYDGSVVWASSEPELLWALRGGGGGFGVLASVVLRVFPYPQDIWAGPILVPREHLDQVADGIAAFLSEQPDPKITMFLYVLKKKLLESLGTVHSDMLVIHALDANGEAHGRESFRWALDIPGAIDQTSITTLAGVAKLQDKIRTVKGTMNQIFAPLLLEDMPRETIINAVKWVESLAEIDKSVADCTYLIFELLGSRDPAGTNASVAYPRPPRAKHLLLLGPGCPSDAGPDKEKLVRELAINAPSRVLGDDAELHFMPNGYEEYLDPAKIWGVHFDKLRELRRKYDPQGRFKAPIKHAV